MHQEVRRDVHTDRAAHRRDVLIEQERARQSQHRVRLDGLDARLASLPPFHHYLQRFQSMEAVDLDRPIRSNQRRNFKPKKSCFRSWKRRNGS